MTKKGGSHFLSVSETGQNKKALHAFSLYKECVINEPPFSGGFRKEGSRTFSENVAEPPFTPKGNKSSADTKKVVDKLLHTVYYVG